MSILSLNNAIEEENYTLIDELYTKTGNSGFTQPLIYLRNHKNINIQNNNFTFKPQISRNSLKIAEKMGHSPERILQKKIDYSKLNKPAENKITLPTKICKEICQSIYEKGLQMNKTKEEGINKIKEEIKSQEPEFTFKPDLSKPGKSRNLNIIHKSNSDILQEFIQRNASWESNKGIKLENNRKKEDEKVEALHSFQPQINQTIMKDDKRLIMRSIDYTSEYVSNRRNFIKKKETEKEEIEKRHCYCDNHKFVASPGRLVTDKPVYNYTGMSKASPSLSQIRALSPNRVLEQRKELGINSFFEENIPISYCKNKHTLTDKNSYALKYTKQQTKQMANVKVLNYKSNTGNFFTIDY